MRGILLKRRRTDPITFVAEYDDGYSEHFDVSRFLLARGDHVGIFVALELQDLGYLKPGSIVRAYRCCVGLDNRSLNFAWCGELLAHQYRATDRV